MHVFKFLPHIDLKSVSARVFLSSRLYLINAASSIKRYTNTFPGFVLSIVQICLSYGDDADVINGRIESVGSRVLTKSS